MEQIKRANAISAMEPLRPAMPSASDSPPATAGTQRIVKVRRDYNAWVADETLEDYALRFTPRAFRKWSELRVANTALGAISFLALEAIGGSLALNYGFFNTVMAIAVVSLLIFLTGLPISYYAANSGVDMDLLTRGAGFGYLGSTVTSLIYAGFTFIFFALEAAIMSLALQMYFRIPLDLAYLLSSLAIIPFVAFGITLINRLQSWTQPLWIVLLVAPYLAIVIRAPHLFVEWSSFGGRQGSAHSFNLVAFGAACTVVFALIVQIAEQVDFLRFLPPRTAKNRVRWWFAMLSAGPGWIIPGALKMLGGAFLTFLALQNEIDPSHATEPTQMYLVAFSYLLKSPEMVLAATTLFVIVSQVKINVTNAYAGSLAWSNFFARLTHSHPGRVVWLIFNVLIALMLVELGVFGALGKVLAFYSIFAIAWIGALVGDLVINKPLGYSPRDIEFKRAHLYDINPVGIGAMVIASGAAAICEGGYFGPIAKALSPFIALFVAFFCAPLIAIATRGRFYIARSGRPLAAGATLRCVICENAFEREDMAQCPAYAGAICSLCCSLDSRCGDACKPDARLSAQLSALLKRAFPGLHPTPQMKRIGLYLAFLTIALTLLGAVLYLAYYQSAATLAADNPEAIHTLSWGYLRAFFALSLVGCVGVWWLVLAKESRTVSQEESKRQTILLMQEIEAHGITDTRLQQASAEADAANRAKSRYVTGLSHELRTPLNSILGYAQLLLRDARDVNASQRDALATIYRSGEHLLALVDGLLDVARIEAGKLQLDVAEFDLPELVAQLNAMMQPQAADKGLNFKMTISGSIPRIVRGDEKRVRQILINLLSNAVRFTAVGSVSLAVSYAWGLAKFEIVDTGEGISEAEMERIFMPFERGSSAGRNDNGTGLGLTICRLLTEMMGGQIDVASQKGQGTHFHLQLFLPEGRRHYSQAPTPPQVSGYLGPRKTILLVDDQSEQRRIVCQMLAPLGFSFREAGSGPEALQLLAIDEVDLIIMDVAMPAMDGFETSRLLRANRLSTAPILILSANAFAGDRDKGREAGCDDYLAKPIHFPLLLEKLATLLDVQWCSNPSLAADEAAPMDEEAMALSTASLPGELLDRLQQHLGMGYLQGFVNCLEEAQASDPELAKSIKPLLDLARRFRLRELENVLSRRSGVDHRAV